MGTIIGYARVSTREQSIAAQEAELREFGAVKVFSDHGRSSRAANRPGWASCLEYLRSGDTLAVRKLDRLAGSEALALSMIGELDGKGVNIVSLTEPAIDTTTPMGRALFGITAVLLQLRVDTIRENTRLGLEHARAQGRLGGRPPALGVEQQDAVMLMHAAGRSPAAIAEVFGVGRTTVRRVLDARQGQS